MKAAFFDIDGTLVADFSGVTFVAFLADNNKFQKENKLNILETTKQYKQGKLTYEQFATAWGKQISSGLKGQNEVNKKNSLTY